MKANTYKLKTWISYRRFCSTMYKNNSRFSSKFKGCSPQHLFCILTEKCNAVGYYSYTYRVRQEEKTICRVTSS